VDQTGWRDQLPGGELNMWTTLSPLGPGDTYRVVSAVSRATIEQLRSAGSNYPAAISERYLQLPDTLPDRVRELARQIVTDAKATTPYDQAAALETWLRKNITYNDQITAPATGQDGVDYLLFVTKQGFCDYYASAMAVMARSLGLPARIATGFASGTLDTQRGVYQVYQNNAHTWPEIYFPQYGWIQFEPTASQPAIERPSAADAANNPNSLNEDQANRSHNPRDAKDPEFDPLSGAANALKPPDNAPIVPAALQTLALLVAGVVGLVLVVGGGGWAAVWWYENRHLPRHTTGGTWAFARLTRLGTWLRVKLSTAHTPFEQAQIIGQVVPNRQGEIDHLAELYVRERYGRAEVGTQETRSIWRRIHWSLWRAGFKRRVLHRLPARPVWLRRRPPE